MAVRFGHQRSCYLQPIPPPGLGSYAGESSEGGLAAGSVKAEMDDAGIIQGCGTQSSDCKLCRLLSVVWLSCRCLRIECHGLIRPRGSAQLCRPCSSSPHVVAEHAQSCLSMFSLAAVLADRVEGLSLACESG